MCGTKSKKFVVDGSFIVAMYSAFLRGVAGFRCGAVRSNSVGTDRRGRSMAVAPSGWRLLARHYYYSLLLGRRCVVGQAREERLRYVLVHLVKNGKSGSSLGCHRGPVLTIVSTTTHWNQYFFNDVLFSVPSVTGPYSRSRDRCGRTRSHGIGGCPADCSFSGDLIGIRK